MSGDTYPVFKAAAVQAAPVFLNREATIDKVETLLQEATEQGAKLSFPVFLSGVWYRLR